MFAEYLQATELLERWRKSRPLSCTSPNAPQRVDVLGTFPSELPSHLRGYTMRSCVVDLGLCNRAVVSLELDDID